MTTPPPPCTLDDAREMLKTLAGPDADARDRALGREGTLTKPPGALGRLEDLAAWLAAWQGRHPPTGGRVRALVFAANHGVTARGVSAYPAAVTAQMVANFESGGAAINQICRVAGADLVVRALDLDTPTRDFTEGAAMDDGECAAAMAAGMAAVGTDADILCLGEMGIGNTTTAAALCHLLFGAAAGDWTGAGTGVAGRALAAKTAVVAEAARRHRDAAGDGIEALRRVGGRELAAIAGAIIAARAARIPVVLDGYVCTAAAAALEKARTGALDHCVVGHVSTEPGHRRLLRAIGKEPLLDLGMRLGEGTGAVLAVGILRAAAACHAGMATFGEAGISGRPDDGAG